MHQYLNTGILKVQILDVSSIWVSGIQIISQGSFAGTQIHFFHENEIHKSIFFNENKLLFGQMAFY